MDLRLVESGGRPSDMTTTEQWPSLATYIVFDSMTLRRSGTRGRREAATRQRVSFVSAQDGPPRGIWS